MVTMHPVFPSSMISETEPTQSQAFHKPWLRSALPPHAACRRRHKKLKKIPTPAAIPTVAKGCSETMLFILSVNVSSIRAAGLATSLAVLFLAVAMAKSFPITKRTMGVYGKNALVERWRLYKIAHQLRNNKNYYPHSIDLTLLCNTRIAARPPIARDPLHTSHEAFSSEVGAW
jgi:hypothetical protein